MIAARWQAMNTDQINQQIMTVLSQLSINAVLDPDNDLIFELRLGDEVFTNCCVPSEEIKQMVATPDDEVRG